MIAGCRPAVDGDGIEILGDLEPEPLDAEYRRAAVFCVPARVEPFGIVFVEALTYSVPVVSTTVGALPDNRPGWRERPTGEAGGGRRARTGRRPAAQPTEEARAFGELGRLRTVERYSWPHVVDDDQDAHVR